MDLFSCPNPKCRVQYFVVRRRTPPPEPPKCEVCNQQFIPTEHGDYLIYQRADSIVIG
jgi:hypothetical protein